MSTQHFSDVDFEQEVLKSELPVLVDFYAEWCGPCKIAAPIIDELAVTYEGKMKIGKVDVDTNNEVAGKFGVMSIPTIIVFKNGKEVDRTVGFGGREAIEQMVKKQIG